MRKEIDRLEKETVKLRMHVKEDEAAHEAMLGIVQGLYREMVGLIEENASLRGSTVARRSPSPNSSPERKTKQVTEAFNQLG